MVIVLDNLRNQRIQIQTQSVVSFEKEPNSAVYSRCDELILNIGSISTTEIVSLEVEGYDTV